MEDKKEFCAFHSLFKDEINQFKSAIHHLGLCDIENRKKEEEEENEEWDEYKYSLSFIFHCLPLQREFRRSVRKQLSPNLTRFVEAICNNNKHAHISLCSDNISFPLDQYMAVTGYAAREFLAHLESVSKYLKELFVYQHKYRHRHRVNCIRRLMATALSKLHEGTVVVEIEKVRNKETVDFRRCVVAVYVVYAMYMQILKVIKYSSYMLAIPSFLTSVMSNFTLEKLQTLPAEPMNEFDEFVTREFCPVRFVKSKVKFDVVIIPILSERLKYFFGKNGERLKSVMASKGLVYEDYRVSSIGYQLLWDEKYNYPHDNTKETLLFTSCIREIDMILLKQVLTQLALSIV